jgi:hypothetical protein
MAGWPLQGHAPAMQGDGGLMGSDDRYGGRESAAYGTRAIDPNAGGVGCVYGHRVRAWAYSACAAS